MVALKTHIMSVCGAAVLAAMAMSAAAVGAPSVAAMSAAAPAQSAATSKVHYTKRKHHHRYRYGRDQVVYAPFTRVETGRRVLVDAPFATVYVSRHGRHIRAPFVDLWVPH